MKDWIAGHASLSSDDSLPLVDTNNPDMPVPFSLKRLGHHLFILRGGFMERLQRVMIGNGLLVVLASMLAGFMLAFGLLGGLEVWPGTIVQIPTYGTTEGWVRAHSGGAMNGLLMMAVALVLPKLNLTTAMQKFVAYGFIYVGWSFTIFYWFGNAAGNRALTFGDNPLGTSDIFGIIGFLPALPSVFLVVVLLVITAKGVFASKTEE